MSGASDRNYEDSVVFGRNGLVGPRPDNEIGMHSLRGTWWETIPWCCFRRRTSGTHAQGFQPHDIASGAVRAASLASGKRAGIV
ncbi:MAG: hypothetical protein ACLSUW_08520 [Akkermansia sp.]